MEAALAVVVITLSLGFVYTNGFHDAANAIATSVSTRALTPRAAVLMAAVMNFVGAMLGTAIAETIVNDIINFQPDPSTGVSPMVRAELLVLLGALVGAITWNLITWWFGLPTSSTHSIIGGLVGAGLAGGFGIYGSSVLENVAIPMIVSPLLGFVLAYFVMVAVMWIFRRANPTKAYRRFRMAQTISAATMALGHGLQDAQKTMGIMFLAMLSVGWATPGDEIPLWVKLSAAAMISLGTYAGGWRIMRTLGRRIIELDPARGFVAESVASSVLYVMAMGAGAPVSTTHTITSSIMGAGATKRLSAVRWGVAGSIVRAWLLTIPAAGLVGAITFWILNALLG